MAELTYVIEVLRVTGPNFLVADDPKKTLLCGVVVQDRRWCALKDFFDVSHTEFRTDYDTLGGKLGQ
jgi:hypothetical protein